MPASNVTPLPIDSFFNESAVPTGSGECIIIVENEKTLLELYEEKVAALGYEPIGCGSISCLKKLLETTDQPDMLIINRKAMATADDVAFVRGRFTPAQILLLSERDYDLRSAPWREARVLRTPFSSAALANAIFDNFTKPSRLPMDACSMTPII